MLAAQIPIRRDVESAAPPLKLLMREAGSFAYTRIRATLAPPVAIPRMGDGRDVIVFPGFMASDSTTARLRRSLAAAGFRTHGWGLGRNRGVKADTLNRVADQMNSLQLQGPATLIGWSLGGLVAREFAKAFPDRVARVITLGSPFSGSPRANNAWRAYELIAGHKVDAPPIDTVLAEKPPVPTFAFWSAGDGVVSAASARGGYGERDHHVELDCTHMSFVADPAAIRAIAAAIIS
jgi:pimeloyl-ACP methyl ester carboxylesterase